MVFKIEKKLGKTFLFSVVKKTKVDEETCWSNLHYNMNGDRDAALESPRCKFLLCRKCPGEQLYYFEGGSTRFVSAPHV